MGDNIINSLVAVAVAIVGIAILAAVLSPNSDAANTIKSFGNFFANIVGKAVSPVN